ncbi:MAG: chemotaxis protein CheW [Myxococcota bacterium]
MSHPTPTVTEGDSSKRQLVTFRIQTRRYAVPIESVAEMTQLHDCHRLAGSPSWILGMMQLRSSVLPVLDLRTRLGLTPLGDAIDGLAGELSRRRRERTEMTHAIARAWEGPNGIDGENGMFQCSLDEERAEKIAASSDWRTIATRIEPEERRLLAAIDGARAARASGGREAGLRAIRRVLDGELRDYSETVDRALRELRSWERPMIIVLSGRDERLGIAVDHIDAVTDVRADEIAARPLQALEHVESSADLIVASVVRQSDPSELIQILDVERVFLSAGVTPPTAASEQTAASA